MVHAQQDMIPLPEAGKKISQEYFDGIVNENMNDFEMSAEEAIADAIEQCKSQGCDTSTICKFPPAEQAELINALRKLDELITTLLGYKLTDMTVGERDEKVVQTMESTNETLALIRAKFEKDLSYKVLATRMAEPNAYMIFKKFFITLDPPSASTDQSANNKFNELTENFINTLQSYVHQQSDVLDTEGKTRNDNLPKLKQLTLSDFD